MPSNLILPMTVSIKDRLSSMISYPSSRSIDMDTVDEQARKNFGYAKEGEKVYLE